jgi:hypothetical protein
VLLQQVSCWSNVRSGLGQQHMHRRQQQQQRAWTEGRQGKALKSCALHTVLVLQSSTSYGAGSARYGSYYI